MRGRKPIPTGLKIAKGIRKSRINANEPQFVADLTPAPCEFMDVYAREEWDRVYPDLNKNGVLKKVDRSVLVGYCEAFSEYRKSSEMLAKNKRQVIKTPNGMEQSSPYISNKRNWLLAMLNFAVELGITPSSRTRLIGENKKPDSSIKDFLKKGFERKP